MKRGYAILSVEGIQQYILGTGKLKEMVGGSELIDRLAQDILEDIFETSGLRNIGPEEPRDGDDWVLTVQRNAGAVHLVLPSLEKARNFVADFQALIMERYPGLPIFGAAVGFEWTADGYGAARREADELIGRARASAPVSCGMPMMPFCHHSRLDGQPAVASEGEEWMSLASKTRRDPTLLNASRGRLRELAKGILPAAVELEWCDDLNELAGSDRARVALIHIDGNDLGNMFRGVLTSDKYKAMPLGQRINEMLKLSKLVENANREAFRCALEVVLKWEWQKRLNGKTGVLIVPLRPLVLGGDDVTVVIRADLALAFVNAYARAFEQKSEQGGKRLSAGVGMVVIPAGYPFTKAFSLAEDLLKSAKRKTAGKERRPSSLDWLVITNDVEPDLESIRRHIAVAQDGARLTSKPLELTAGAMETFVANAWKALTLLPRSSVRGVLNQCRLGVKHAQDDYDRQCARLRRGLGSGNMSETMFRQLFPDDSYFRRVGHAGDRYTELADYLELETLLPSLDGGDLHELFADLPALPEIKE